MEMAHKPFKTQKIHGRMTPALIQLHGIVDSIIAKNGASHSLNIWPKKQDILSPWREHVPTSDPVWTANGGKLLKYFPEF